MSVRGADPRWRRRTGLAALGVAAGALALAGLHLDHERERARRRRASAGHLRSLGVATITYMTDTVGPASRRGFMPHVTGVNEEDGPEHVGHVFEKLVAGGEIDDPAVLVCPASEDAPCPLPLGSPRAEYRMAVHDVRRADAPFSYGWVRLQQTDGCAGGARLISADRSVSDPGWLAQHRDGRNFLRFDGSVDWCPRDVESASGALHDEDTLRYLLELNLARPGGLPDSP